MRVDQLGFGWGAAVARCALLGPRCEPSRPRGCDHAFQTLCQHEQRLSRAAERCSTLLAQWHGAAGSIKKSMSGMPRRRCAVGAPAASTTSESPGRTVAGVPMFGARSICVDSETVEFEADATVAHACSPRKWWQVGLPRRELIADARGFAHARRRAEQQSEESRSGLAHERRHALGPKREREARPTHRDCGLGSQTVAR